MQKEHLHIYVTQKPWKSIRTLVQSLIVKLIVKLLFYVFIFQIKIWENSQKYFNTFHIQI